MFIVYFYDSSRDLANGVTCDSINEALRKAEALRKYGYEMVTIASKNSDSVGKEGVDSVVNGLLPDGTPYSWFKRRR